MGWIRKFDHHASFERRVEESAWIRKRHPQHVPIIVHGKDFYKKYLLRKGSSWIHLLMKLRKDYSLRDREGLYAFIVHNDVSSHLQTPHRLIEAIDEEYRSDDGFIHVLVEEEATFG